MDRISSSLIFSRNWSKNINQNVLTEKSALQFTDVEKNCLGLKMTVHRMSEHLYLIGYGNQCSVNINFDTGSCVEWVRLILNI